ncbi:regulatory protein GemA [Methylosinus sp. H3A]|uniref:regulatory protein GemA n=1 Tax=Methylosinus sp. H3A TaxID=2785786 RepID=UPI0018C24B05|nr:regulatory protein GemA [Methylosinus sp. H3A]MBG0809877.1 regulatory protein GemA [Methylosinus sp. H3A]
MTTASQTRAIHSIRKTIPSFGEDDYRALIAREFGGRTSSRHLTEREAIRLIDLLKGLAGQQSGRHAAETASGKYAPILRALWIGAYNLGIARSRDDAALLAFVERQTKLAHTRFLNDPADARKAIEALKKWMARAGCVDWPKDRGEDVIARKRALLRAIAERCVETGAFVPFVRETGFEGAWPSDFEAYGKQRGLAAAFGHYEPEDYDRLMHWLGQRLRKQLGDKMREAA